MDSCPHCGADLPPKAKACPACGSDEQTGWSEQSRYDGLDLPDEEFDHADFVRREFRASPLKPRGIHWLWWAVAILLLAGFALMSFH
jgi:hypothetical protein